MHPYPSSPSLPSPSLPLPLPLPSLFLPLPLPSLSLPSPAFPLPLEVGPLNPARGLGVCSKLRQWGLGQSPSRNQI